MSLIVQKLRLQRGWSQQQLAELSGLSSRTIQRIEGGQKATAESLKSLAAVFEVDFQALRSALDESPALSASVASVPFAQPLPLPQEGTAPDRAEMPAMTSTNLPFTPRDATPDDFLKDMPADEVQAFRDVRRLRGFYIHALQYVFVITGLVILNATLSPGRWWAHWPALGWGIGLAAHGLAIWKRNPILGAEWERRQIERRIGRKL